MISDRQLSFVQDISGLTFSSFLMFHVMNTTAGISGATTYDAVQRQLRPFYQNPLIESVVLIGSGLTHAICGILKVKRRSNRQAQVSANRFQLPLGLRLHRASAYILTILAVGHFYATRVMTRHLAKKVDGSSFVANSLDQFGVPFYLYYLLLLASGIYHMTFGLSQMFVKYTSVGNIVRRAQPMTAVGLVMLGYAGLLGLGGHFGSVVDRSRFAEYRNLYN